MEHERLTNDVLWALESCRPGRQDENLPEAAERLAHVSSEQVASTRRSLERVDRAVITAMQQVPVPAGLAERLLERLAAAEPVAADLSAAGTKSCVPPRIEPAHKPVQAAPLRSKWLVAGGALALAASVLIALVIWPRESIELAEMQTEVRTVYEAEDHLAASAVSSVPPDTTALGGVSSEWVVGWHAIELLDRSGYAYELAHRRARRTQYRGTLYVVPLKAWRGPVLSGLRSDAVVQSTSGTTIAAWTDNTNAYFLVARGDSRAISAFLAKSMA